MPRRNRDRRLQRREPRTSPPPTCCTRWSGWQPPRRLPVALASSGYDMVVGDGLLPRAGACSRRSLPQKRVVVVTDETVARAAPAGPAGRPGGDRRSPRAPDRGPAGRGLEERRDLRRAGRPDARRRRGAADGGAGAGRRRGRRPRRLRGGDHAARPALRADADDAAGAGGQQRRRQDRDQHARSARTWSAPSTSRAWCWPTPRRWRRCRSRELRAGYAEIAKAGLIGDAVFFAVVRGAMAPPLVGGDRGAQAEAVLRACAFKAAVVGGDEREEKPERRPRPAQPRPHLRATRWRPNTATAAASCTARRSPSASASPSASPPGSACAPRRTRPGSSRTSKRAACRRAATC